MRLLPHTSEDRQEMLAAIGVGSVDDLYQAVPKECHLSEPLPLPETLGEIEITRYFQSLAARNADATHRSHFLGAGCYYHHIPAAVDHLIQRSEFLTAYTPYQAEISQGTLAVIFQFQSMIARLTGMEIANASMYDGASSVAEAALMARRVTRREDIHVYGNIHRDYLETLHTYIEALDGEVKQGMPTKDTACVIVQIPDFYGNITALEELRKACDETGALLVVAVTELVSLGLLPPPELADIVAGEAQSIGVAMQLGGPHLGFFACKKKHVRQMPGRLCGMTEDAEGKRSFVLTLNTREQHIRRDRATSNICSNQGLCATACTIHLSLLGEQGFKQLALLNHQRACLLADALAEIGTIENDTFFNEFVVRFDREVNSEYLIHKHITPGLMLDPHRMLIAATEMTTLEDINALKAALQEDEAWKMN